MPICECGCGEFFEPGSGSKGRPKRYIFGHYYRTPEATEARRLGKLRQRKKPPADRPTHGFCLCGCGQRTNVAKESSRSTNSYAGYPMLYIRGHNAHPGGPDSPGFIGRRNMSSGYVYIYRPDHPACLKRGGFEGYILEHRVVWEEANGRSLRDNEHVHHINGVRDDNRPENLVALTRSEHISLHRRAKVSAETRRKLSASAHAIWERRRRGELPWPKNCRHFVSP